MYRRILVPIDGSATAAKGLDEAISLARLTGATLCLFHAIDGQNVALGYDGFAVDGGDVLSMLKEAAAQILEQAKALATAAAVRVETVLHEGFAERVSDRVVEQAKAIGADLIVIGTHGRRGIARVLIGSDAEQIVRTAPVPVLLVRAPED